MNFLKRVDEMLDEERRVKYDTQDSVIVLVENILHKMIHVRLTLLILCVT